MEYFNGLISVLTLIVAYNALRVWKNQLRGTDRYNLLKNILKSIYKFEEEVRSVRNPVIWYNNQHTDNKSKIEEEKEIYNKRYNALVKEFLTLKPLLMECKIHGNREKIEELFNPLESIVGELRGGI